jgi:hypothetical protein
MPTALHCRAPGRTHAKALLGDFAWLRKALLGAAVLLLSVSPAGGAAEPTGRDVIRRMHAALQRGDGASKRYQLRLIDAGGTVTAREVAAYRKRCGESTRDLLVLRAPPDLAGSAVLSWTFAERLPNVWLYLPELGRVRQVNPFAQGDSFMGSDLTYADLGPIPLDARTHRLAGEGWLDGEPVYEIVSTPNGPEPYSRVVTWVSALTFLPLQVEYFDPAGRLLRRGRARDVQLVQGVPTPFALEMDDVQQQHRTELALLDVDYDLPLDCGLFTKRRLHRAR